MMRMTMVLALGLACAVSAWAYDAPEVATAERIGLAYNQLGHPDGTPTIALPLKDGRNRRYPLGLLTVED